VSRGTVRVAMRVLRESGLVVTVQARGSFVAER
jgi:GntR family transcriptional regulator